MAFHRNSDESKRRGVTYHLVPSTVWNAQRETTLYLPEAFERDGFIHCTNGVDQLLMVANLFYADDPREFVVLALDVASVACEVRYDDAEHLFPHIYGPLNTSAVIGQTTVERSVNGSFIAIAG